MIAIRARVRARSTWMAAARHRPFERRLQCLSRQRIGCASQTESVASRDDYEPGRHLGRSDASECVYCPASAPGHRARGQHAARTARERADPAVSDRASPALRRQRRGAPGSPTSAFTYSPNDTSAADLDGDGEHELVVKDPSNSRDNASAGLSGRQLIDAYKIDGTRLWRIDLGRNIRAAPTTRSSWSTTSTATAAPKWRARPPTALPTAPAP